MSVLVGDPLPVVIDRDSNPVVYLVAFVMRFQAATFRYGTAVGHRTEYMGVIRTPGRREGGERIPPPRLRPFSAPRGASAADAAFRPGPRAGFFDFGVSRRLFGGRLPPLARGPCTRIRLSKSPAKAWELSSRRTAMARERSQALSVRFFPSLRVHVQKLERLTCPVGQVGPGSWDSRLGGEVGM
jgi:hypothetical protein